MMRVEKRAREHFRGKPRPGRKISLGYRPREGTLVRTVTRDIGVGGAFVLTRAPLSVGSELVLVLDVPERPVTVKA